MNYFTLPELLRTSQDHSNLPSWDAIIGLIALRDNVLNPTRKRLGKAIHVTSGYRCDAVNELVGGSPSSQHIACALYAAADLDQGSNKANRELYNAIKSTCTFDQLINENDYSWVHVSFRTDGKNRLQAM